jgi:signal transduction histidine kinase
MAAGIAHEIRNPLNAIRGFADLLRRRLEPGTREARWGGLIVEGVDDVDAIIKSMLTFADPNRLQPETVDGREVVERAVEQALSSMREEHSDRWHVTWTVTAPPFRADRIKLRQAIRNLVANALEAQPEGGRVEVALEAQGSEIVATVDDEGPGIAEELRHRVVDPFFTTRPEGTGLGLALVHTIAQLHGGRFEIGARPGCVSGTRAVVRFPITQDC